MQRLRSPAPLSEQQPHAAPSRPAVPLLQTAASVPALAAIAALVPALAVAAALVPALAAIAASVPALAAIVASVPALGVAAASVPDLGEALSAAVQEARAAVTAVAAAPLAERDEDRTSQKKQITKTTIIGECGLPHSPFFVIRSWVFHNRHCKWLC